MRRALKLARHVVAMTLNIAAASLFLIVIAIHFVGEAFDDSRRLGNYD
jgi:hypothetical protein